MAQNKENREIAIQLSGVKKMYKLGQIGGGTLQADIQSWWARKRGKEDPNTKIGQEERLVGKTFMALNGIDLTVYQGEALGIIGGNGAGKSTMLKLLSQVTAPTAGTIDLYGRVASMLEVGTGFNGEMTGRENVYMNGAILGMTKAEIDAKMEDIIEFSEVRDFIDTPVKRYSSGMYVKLAFSVAAHLDSEIMIMDEVLAVGDMAFQKKCLDKMRDAAKKEGRTVLYVSHNMNTIRQLCDRCVVLDNGRIIFRGDVGDAIQLYLGGGKQLAIRKEIDDERNKMYSLDERVRVRSIELVDKTWPVYEFGEILKLSVRFSSTASFNNLSIRFTIINNEGLPIGMGSTASSLSAHQGENSYSLEMNIDALAPGRYSMKLVIFEMNEYGAFRNIDVVDDAFSFEKVQGAGLEWHNNLWGYIMLPPIFVK